MSKKIFWRTNEQIPDGILRVIKEDGSQLGVISRKEALEKAKEEGKDLIEIAPKARPPVAKIIEFGKFKYQEEKRLKKQRVGSKAADVKEVRLSPFIGEADYKTRLERVNEFLKDGDKVRLVVKFKGRQMDSKPFGYKVLERLIKELEHEINVDMEPKFLGRHLAMVISPIKKPKAKKTEIKSEVKKVEKKEEKNEKK